MKPFFLFTALVLVLAPGWVGGHAPEKHQFRLTPFTPPFSAPGFRAARLGGGELSLADLHGKVVLLNFWATWCAPCVREMPAMEKLYRSFRHRGLVVVAVSLDREGAALVAPFIQRLDLTFPIALDVASRVAGVYGARELPASFLINTRGEVFAAAKGERDWFSSAAQSYLDEVLPPAPTTTLTSTSAGE